jgi:hypothetical protein
MLPLEGFYKNASTGDGYSGWCVECVKEDKRNRRAAHPKREWWHSSFDNSNRRARDAGIAFEFERDRPLECPDLCPVFGFPLDYNVARGVRGGAYNSPTVDRIDNNKGYTYDNCVVVSNRANGMKRNATATELFQLAHYYQQKEEEESERRQKHDTQQDQ